MKTTVLLTGANSLLGVNTIRILLARGYAVRGMLRNKATYVGPLDSALELREGSFADPDCLRQAMAGCQYVVHCAAKTGQSGSYASYRQINIDATEQLIQCAVQCGVQRIVCVGSANMFAYGDKEHPGDESAPIRYPFTESAYAKSKFEMQGLIERYLSQIEIVTVCPTFMLGKYDSRPSSGRIIQMTYGKKWLFYPPGGKNFVHVADVAQGIVAALQQGRNGEYYLLANENISYRDFFAAVASLSGQHAVLIPLPAWLLLIVGRFGDLLQRMGLETELNSVNMRILCVKNYYSNRKSIEQLQMTYRPVMQAVTDAVAWFHQYRPQWLRK